MTPAGQAKKPDDDEHFCLSLHKELLKVPEHRRMHIKIEVMNVILRGQIESPTERQSPYSQRHIYHNFSNFDSPAPSTSFEHRFQTRTTPSPASTDSQQDSIYLDLF